MTGAKKKSDPIAASKLAIIDRDDFTVLDSHPIDALSDSSYRTIEQLCTQLVLRAQRPGATRLANETLIDLFDYETTTRSGARDASKVALNEDFLIPVGVDCSMFSFCYTRAQVPGVLLASNLDSNGPAVFQSEVERCACRVGKHNNVEDSCIKSIFYHLRNAFAHGRIALMETTSDLYLFAEDGCSPREVNWDVSKPSNPLEINFRAVLKVKTITDWYQLLLDKSATR